jgi:hypothetical protein
VLKRGCCILVGKIDEYILAPFSSDDEPEIVDLFNRRYERFAGFVPRTVEYWRWCCLYRPDVKTRGILTVRKKNRLVGYIVIGNSGNIWDLCCASGSDEKIVISTLLSAATDYAKSESIDGLVLNAYVHDKIVHQVCQELDFSQAPSETLFLSVLNLPELISSVLKEQKQNFKETEVFWFKLKNCPPWCVNSFGVKLCSNQVLVSTNDDGFPKTTITVEMTTLVSLMFGNKNLAKMILLGRVRFGGFWKILKVVRFLRLLKSNSPWFTPRTDLA